MLKVLSQSGAHHDKWSARNYIITFQNDFVGHFSFLLPNHSRQLKVKFVSKQTMFH